MGQVAALAARGEIFVVPRRALPGQDGCGAVRRGATARLLATRRWGWLAQVRPSQGWRGLGRGAQGRPGVAARPGPSSSAAPGSTEGSSTCACTSAADRRWAMGSRLSCKPSGTSGALATTQWLVQVGLQRRSGGGSSLAHSVVLIAGGLLARNGGRKKGSMVMLTAGNNRGLPCGHCPLRPQRHRSAGARSSTFQRSLPPTGTASSSGCQCRSRVRAGARAPPRPARAPFSGQSSSDFQAAPAALRGPRTPAACPRCRGNAAGAEKAQQHRLAHHQTRTPAGQRHLRLFHTKGARHSAHSGGSPCRMAGRLLSTPRSSFALCRRR